MPLKMQKEGIQTQRILPKPVIAFLIRHYATTFLERQGKQGLNAYGPAFHFLIRGKHFRQRCAEGTQLGKDYRRCQFIIIGLYKRCERRMLVSAVSEEDHLPASSLFASAVKHLLCRASFQHLAQPCLDLGKFVHIILILLKHRGNDPLPWDKGDISIG